MFLALTTLTWLKSLREPRKPVAIGAPRRVPARAPALCFELLVPYYDAREAARNGQPRDTRHALLVTVWAPDVQMAIGYARERFRDHRFLTGGTARLAPEGPVALRIARELEERR